MKTKTIRLPALEPGTLLLSAMCIGLLIFVSWSLLIPDPYAIVRETSLAWLEQVSDLLTHAAVFTVLSALWLHLAQRIAGRLPPIMLFGMLGYCVIVEALQAFVPGRHCGPRDALANVAGFVFGLAIVRLATLVRRTSPGAPGSLPSCHPSATDWKSVVQ